MKIPIEPLTFKDIAISATLLLASSELPTSFAGS